MAFAEKICAKKLVRPGARGCERVRELDSRLNPEELFHAVLHRWSVQQRKTGVVQNGPISTDKTGVQLR